MVQEREVFIVGYARTPIGNLNGSLAAVSAPVLGATAVKAALARARVSASEVQAMYKGNVLTGNVGQAPARQVCESAASAQKRSKH